MASGMKNWEPHPWWARQAGVGGDEEGLSFLTDFIRNKQEKLAGVYLRSRCTQLITCI